MDSREKLEAYESIQDNAQEIVSIDFENDKQLKYVEKAMRLFKEAIISVINNKNGYWEEQQEQTSFSSEK
jgi:hypothetical protein